MTNAERFAVAIVDTSADDRAWLLASNEVHRTNLDALAWLPKRDIVALAKSHGAARIELSRRLHDVGITEALAVIGAM